MDYAKNLKQARKWAGMTQAELARKAGIATITVRQYEAGNRKPTTDNWFAIADALHLSIDELNDAESLPMGPFNPDDIEDAKFLIGVKEGEFHTRMNTAFFNLNFSGKQEAVKRVEELTEIPRYRRQDAPQSPPAPQGGNDTAPPPDAPETAQEGE